MKTQTLDHTIIKMYVYLLLIVDMTGKMERAGGYGKLVTSIFQLHNIPICHYMLTLQHGKGVIPSEYFIGLQYIIEAKRDF